MPRGTRSAGRRVADWNIDKLIAAFAGIEPLIVEHRGHGFAPLTYSQVSHWRLRHQIPSDKLAELFVVMRHRDGEVDPMLYVVAKQ